MEVIKEAVDRLTGLPDRRDEANEEGRKNAMHGCVVEGLNRVILECVGIPMKP